MERRRSTSHCRPVSLSSSPASKSSKPLELWLDAGEVALERLAVEQVALLGAPAGVADHAGRPAGQRKRTVPGELEPAQTELTHQVADVQRVGGRVEADVDADRSGLQAGGERREIGAVVDQTTGLEIGDQVHVAEPYSAAWCRRIHYVAAVSHGDRRAVAACQQLFADFAQTSDAPLYADLAAGIADDPELAGLLLAAPPPQRLPVLLFASVHWLLLADPTAPLARFYPNLPVPPEPAGPARSARSTPSATFCAERCGELAELLATRRTQTNEIGRSALFVPSLAMLAAECGAARPRRRRRQRRAQPADPPLRLRLRAGRGARDRARP